jgi:hypothetical protein
MGYNISSPGVRSTKVRRRYDTTKARLPLPSSISGGRPPTNTCDRSPLMNVTRKKGVNPYIELKKINNLK